MNQQTFLQAEPSSFTMMYSGKSAGCRCGCRGNYYSAVPHSSADTEVEPELVQRRLAYAQKMVKTGAQVEFGPNYVDVEVSTGRCLTFYFERQPKVQPFESC